MNTTTMQATPKAQENVRQANQQQVPIDTRPGKAAPSGNIGANMPSQQQYVACCKAAKQQTG